MISRLVSSQGINEAELSVTFVGKERIRRLNREYLGHDRVTDVISFNLSGPGESPLLGDIYVCVPRSRQQARWFGAGQDEELARLCAHGALHVLGFDHEKPEDAASMELRQEQAVREFIGGKPGAGTSHKP